MMTPNASITTPAESAEHDEHQIRSSSPSFDDLGNLDGLDDILQLAENEDPGLLAYYAPTNAVHMEIQENAKLPTFNLKVDRTNSSQVSSTKRKAGEQYSPTTQKDIDEMVKLSENDFSLTEVFLKTNDRSSMSMNYNNMPSNANTIPTTTATAYKKLSRPTEERTQPSLAGDSVLTGTPALQTRTATTVTTQGDRNYHSNYYPYGRSHQLPIPHVNQAPTPAPPPAVALSTTAAAVAADAASVSPSQTTTTVLPQLLTPNPLLNTDLSQAPPSVHSNTAPNSIVTATPTVPLPPAPLSFSSDAPSPSNSSSAAPSTTKPIIQRSPSFCGATAAPTRSTSAIRKASSKPAPITKHSPPSASIVEATKRRAQFGFGGDHVIPSVPMPPTKRKKRSSDISAGPLSPSKAVSAGHTPGFLPPAGGGTAPAVNSGAAYERKKQRAKDARVKLNESIERLSVAISLAGSQTQQRLAHVNMEHTKTVMQDCVKTAEMAKKWDRPSFVGTAATLIQGLNAQCEALLREVEKLKQEQQPKLSIVSAVSSSTLSSASTSKRRRFVEKQGEGDEAEKEEQDVLRTKALLQKIADFLDPVSLLRCNRAAHHIKEVCNADDVWFERCIQRFGVVNVRQWKETQDGSISAVRLYQEMDGANVKPCCGSGFSMAGTALGEARIPGKVSTWLIMVERSNGETYRSVQRPPTSKPEEGGGMYTSLPVIELRILVQNTGSPTPIGIKEQRIVVDASTRRRGDEFSEIDWDNRLAKQLTVFENNNDEIEIEGKGRPEQHILHELRMYESVVLTLHIQAKGCSTTSKFQQRANFTQVLVSVNETTVPLVIPFVREHSK